MTFIIAEIGVNHDGSWTKGLDLIDAAKRSGTDACKFQLFNSQKLWGDDRTKHLEFSHDALLAMKAHCDEINIEFMCTPFDVEAVEFLTPLVKRMKIGSGCRKQDILEAVKKTGLPILLSTGMADMAKIYAVIKAYDLEDVLLMLCTSSYPCKPKDVNLKVLEHEWFYGFSDHTQGITASIAAVALGATVIEKHLTLDKTADGPDHKSSIEPNEFKTMVEAIREVEIMLGDGIKRVLPCEEKLRSEWYG